MYADFCKDILMKEAHLPFNEMDILYFIAHLTTLGRAPSCITSYLSALSFVHKLNNLPDPIESAVVQKSLQGVKKQNPGSDSRLPITKNILYTLYHKAPIALANQYDFILFRALCLLAFHGFFRIGELVDKGTQPRTVKLGDVQITQEGLRVVIPRSKTSSSPQVITVRELSNNVCPVEASRQYLALRGTCPGQYFAHPDGSPISRQNFISMLNKVLTLCGLDPGRYKGHSFRIGAASEAAREGYSDAQIRLMGRWNSDAFRKYIRLAY